MTQCIIKQFAAYYDAVLSHYFIHHGENLRQSNKTALYETGHHLYVTDNFIVNFRSAIIIAIFIPDRFR